MPTARVIPCLDVRDGRVVKGVRFRELRDIGDPAALAARYETQGADEVVFLDVSASVRGHQTTLATVRRAAEQLTIPLTVGGGIRSVRDVRRALGSGADKVAVNTAAVRRPKLLTEAAAEFGSQCMVLAIDARSGPGGWLVHTHGGRRPTQRMAPAWAAEGVSKGAGEILLTSMDADGTTAGYDLALTSAVCAEVGVPVIASGGAGTLRHFVDVLSSTPAAAALAASVFHDRTFSIADVKGALRRAGVPVRPIPAPQRATASDATAPGHRRRVRA